MEGKITFRSTYEDGSPLVQEFPLSQQNINLLGKLTPEVITQLHSFPQLEELSTGQDVSGTDFSTLPEGLKELALTGSNVTGQQLRNLPSGLTTLYLAQTSVKDADLPHLPKGLSYLGLQDCSSITGSSFGELPQTLKSLGLDNIHKVRDKSLAELPANIENLDIRRTKISIAGLKNLEHLKNLRQLNIRGSAADTVENTAFLTEMVARAEFEGRSLLIMSHNITIERKDVRQALQGLESTPCGEISTGTAGLAVAVEKARE